MRVRIALNIYALDPTSVRLLYTSRIIVGRVEVNKLNIIAICACALLTSCSEEISCGSDGVKEYFLGNFKSGMGKQLRDEYDIDAATITFANTRTVREEGNGKVCASEVYIEAINKDPKPDDTTNGEPLKSVSVRNYFIQLTDDGKLFVKRI